MRDRCSAGRWPGLVAALVAGLLVPPVLSLRAQTLPGGLTIETDRSGMNAVTIQHPDREDDDYLTIYGGSESHPARRAVLVPHGRRDAVRLARRHRDGRAYLAAPEGLSGRLDAVSVVEHWAAWWDDRFDYYGQQVTHLPVEGAAFWPVASGTRWNEAGFEIEAFATPGYTREGMSYLVNVEGVRVAFTGDLILSGARLPDLYSFQDRVPEAKIGAYHGYGSRFKAQITSLQRLMDLQPDLVVPLRGEVIHEPTRSAEELIRKLREIYRNYLSTNALNWYFKEERLTVAGRQVLGPEAEIELMSYVEHIDLPSWCQHLGTTKLLLAESGRAFALDVGGTRALDELEKSLEEGLIKGIDGIFVTHVHNDHSQAVAEAAERFGCPVYAVEEVARVLEQPSAWFWPGLSPNRVLEVQRLEPNAPLQWEEFSLKGHFFPGQMYPHGALLVERNRADEGEVPVFFIGDSFSPSGIDDYCLLNRNLIREDQGYFLCFRILRALPSGTWLVNQHIPHRFRFSEEELAGLEARYRQRRELIAQTVAWDDPNYGIDEQWAWCQPYGQELSGKGAPVEIEVEIWNHSPKERLFTVERDPTPASYRGPVVDWEGATPNTPHTEEIRLKAGEVGHVRFRGAAVARGTREVGVLTFSVDDGDRRHEGRCEALVKMRSP